MTFPGVIVVVDVQYPGAVVGQQRHPAGERDDRRGAVRRMKRRQAHYGRDCHKQALDRPPSESTQHTFFGVRYSESWAQYNKFSLAPKMLSKWSAPKLKFFYKSNVNNHFCPGAARQIG